MSHHRKGRNPDANKLIIYHNPTGSATFDPRIITSVSSTVIWETEVGRTVTTGTTHDLSYTPTAGAKICKVTVVGGLGLVTGIDFRSDALTNVKNMRKLNATLASLYLHSNNNLQITTADIPRVVGPIDIETTLLSGDLSALRGSYTIAQFQNCPNLVGDIVVFSPMSSMTQLYVLNDPGVYGSFTSLPASLQTLYTYGSIISASSVAHLVAIRDLRIYSMGWNQAGVDTVLLSASDAVWADAAHYTYIAPSLQIQSNAVPGGSAGADTTDPMTTPGSGNSNTDWQWDEVAGKHKALTGKAAIWFLAHNTGHAWIITYQTV